MITLTLADYAIITIVCLAATLRIISDIRDIQEAKFIKNTKKALGERTFSPKLTIVIPLESLENTKQTLKRFSEGNLSAKVVIVIDSKTQSRATGPLRYFVRKHALKQVTVTGRKEPRIPVIAGEYAKTGLAVILPDTSRLQESFYQDVILPFGDPTVDAVQMIPNVRTDKTLGSGIEVLFSAWRRYISMNGICRSAAVLDDSLPEGVIVRAKLLRKPPKRKLNNLLSRRAIYSVAAQKNVRSTWSKLQKSAGLADYFAVLVIAASTLLLLNLPYSAMLTTGVFIVVYILFVWWSLGASRISLVDRISVLLLSPFFFVIAISFVAARIVQYVTLLANAVKTSFTKMYQRSRATSTRS